MYRKYNDYFKDYYKKNKEEINKKRKIYYHNVLKKKKIIENETNQEKINELKKEIEDYKNNKNITINESIKAEDYEKKKYNFSIRHNVILGIT